MEGRTCVVVAHRLTTVRAAHKIAVVQRGVVVEEGTHEDLVQKNGAYAQLNRAQAGTQSACDDVNVRDCCSTAEDEEDFSPGLAPHPFLGILKALDAHKKQETR